jgi:hypothetical protein
MASSLLYECVIDSTTPSGRELGAMSARTRKPLLFFTSVMLFGMVAVGGASSVASATPRGPDVRGQAVLNVGAPQLLVEGPARLLHVDFEGARAVSLYSVDSWNVGADACRAGAPAAKRLGLHTNVRNALDLDVPPGRAMCLVAEDGSVQVAWHAQATPLPGGRAGKEVLHASNR